MKNEIIVKYQVWVAGKEDMERHGPLFDDEKRAILCAQRLADGFLGSVMVEKVTSEIVFNG